jgi:lysine 2,3-aminomutase
MRDPREIPLWKGTPRDKWCDWHWQMRNAVTSLDSLEKTIHLSAEERHGVEVASIYLKMRITPHIVALMDPDDPDDPLRRQFIPSSREVGSIDDDLLFADVNADEAFSPTRGLVHRYPSKVLVIPSNYCGAYCRYCFRRKLVKDVENSVSKEDMQRILAYLNTVPEVNEVIFSGGDPLVLGDDTLGYMLNSLAEIPHISIVRFHTRLPVTLPYRITPRLISLLAHYRSRFALYVVMHIDTPGEITDAMRESVSGLVDSGVPCLASCPLLRGINDSEDTLGVLWTELVKMRVKPYYLFHSDPVKGLRHFLVPIERGIEIVHNLYDSMSGLGMPLYCLNVPNGGGHVLLGYDYVRKIGEGRYLITTFEGAQVEYVERVESGQW